MHVCINIDCNYIFPAVAMIESLNFHLSKNVTMNLHILCEEFNMKNYSLFIKYLKSRGINHEFYLIDSELFKNVKVTHHISKATYFRLLIEKVVPNSIKRILFLDCDLIIMKNITDLYNTNLNDYEIACIEENIGHEHLKRLRILNEDFHFNAGVLLINLEKWRTNNITSKLLKNLSENIDSLVYWDQDILNLTIKNKIKLDKYWNLTETNLKECFNSSVENFGIIHYTGSCKPWNCSSHPYRDYFFKHYSNRFDYNKLKILHQFVKLRDNSTLLRRITRRIIGINLYLNPTNLKLYHKFLN